jgi:hypothetical protein
MLADLTAKQLRSLKILHRAVWLTRAQMAEHAGPTGFSLALGAPTRGDVRPGSLEQLGYVERRDVTAPFEYRITELGERALAEYERQHGDVLLRCNLSDHGRGQGAGCVVGHQPQAIEAGRPMLSQYLGPKGSQRNRLEAKTRDWFSPSGPDTLEGGQHHGKYISSFLEVR